MEWVNLCEWRVSSRGVKQEDKRNAGRTVWQRSPKCQERQQRQTFHGRLDRSLSSDLAGWTKRGWSCGCLGLRPGRALSYRLPWEAWPQYMMVQFQHQKDVHLHQDGKPGNKCALRMTPTKKGRGFEARIAHKSRPEKGCPNAKRRLSTTIVFWKRCTHRGPEHGI
jgi:hypothetical protein